MRLRPDDVTGTAVVGVAGAVWGLGLARLLGEVGLQPVFYGSAPVVGLIALGCAAAVVALWRLLSPFCGPSSAVPLALPALYAAGVAASPLAGGVLLIGGAGLAALITALVVWPNRRGWLLPALLGLVTLAVNVRTLLPSIGEADTLEFQVVAPKLGVAHPTGYPLYILLAKLFTLLPFRSVAWRVNLASAVFAAGAVVVLYATVHRLTGRPLLSFLSGLAFAFSRPFWSQAVIAEVYTLHNLLVASILWLLLCGQRGRGDGETGKVPQRPARWQAIFFLMGLSVTNHLTAVLLVPATGLALLWDRPRLRVRDWLVAGGLFLLGLCVYLFIPLRWPALNDGQGMTLREFVTYVTGGQFHGALRLDGWRDPARWRIVGRLLHEPFGWIGLGLAALGVTNLAMRGRRALVLTAATFVAFVIYGLDYIVGDIAVFLLPAHAVLALWMGSGVALLAGLPAPALESARLKSADGMWRVGLATLFAVMALSRVWINLPAVDRSRDGGSEAWGRYVLTRPLAEGSAILADTKKFAPLYYLQQVEGVRPDLDIVVLGSEALYQADLRQRLAAGQTVYLARYLPHLEGFRLRSVGPLAQLGGGRLGGDEGAVSGGESSSGAVLGGFDAGIVLLGADVEKDPLGRALYHVTLHWQAERAVGSDLVVRLRLVDADSEVRWIGEGRRPVSGLYPINAWADGVPIPDYHEVSIPDWLPPGSYRLEVGLFAPFDDRGVMLDDGTTGWLTLQELDVEPPSDPDPLPDRRLSSFDRGVWLTGFDAPGEVTAGTPFEVDLAWQGVGRDERARLWWAVSSGRELAAEGRQVEEAGSTLVEGMLRSRHTISAPEEVGVYTLRVGLVEAAGRCSWLASPTSGCSLTQVRVVSGEEGLSNFGDRVLLLDADVLQGPAMPGEVIRVALRWRGLRTMVKDYTVFVHLVGPDGRLHGQKDSWPVQGTYPTSQWAPRIEVGDAYEVPLASDAPPGPYRVEVGWYDLETMQRLQIVDEAGEAVADSYVVGTFDVPQ